MHFAVWAPNADRVSVIGDFNGWDGRVHPMRLLRRAASGRSSSPISRDGESYKFEIRTTDAATLLKKSDPFGVRVRGAAAIGGDRPRHLRLHVARR